MEKRMLLGVQKKRPVKRHKKKLLQKVLDYLVSDSYMFAPLIAQLPHCFSSPMKTRASIPGVQAKKPIRVNNKTLLNKVGDYLKSDSYMYAPLLAPPPTSTSSPPQGSSQNFKRVITVAVSKRKLFIEDNQLNETVAKEIADDRAFKACLPEKIITEHQPVMQKETVKHVVNHSCRSSSISGALDNSILRAEHHCISNF